MYRIKAKPGYNVIVKDLGITFRSAGDWINVEKAIFDSSEDAKRVANLLLIEGAEDIKTENKVEDIVKEDNILQVAETSFVTRPAFEENPKDVFIANPSIIDVSQVVEAAKEVEVPVEEIITEETKVTVLDDDNGEQEIVNTTTVEVEVPVEEAKAKVTEEVKEVKKPVAKKGNNKK